MGEISETIGWVERLVGFDTVSRNSNLPLIEDVQGYLAGLGIASHLVPNAEGNKANLYATIGPMAPGGVVLSGHTDVVPVDGQDWITDPFKLVEKDGLYFGRGACDMKSFIAIALSMIPQMQAADMKRPIHLALSYDEELACLGAPFMIAEMVEKLPPIRAVVVGEPTEMEVVTAHKGFLGLTTKVRGHEVHSALLHTGVSAVMRAARLITWLDDRTQANAAREPYPGFTPGYTTLHCGVVQGGTAQNIVAKDCEFTTDIRVIPSDDARAIKAEYEAEVARMVAKMQAVAPDTGVTIDIYADAPGLKPEQDGEAEALARSITGHNGTRVESYAAEAGQFQEAGYSTIMCGPGSIAQAHQPNEFISARQIDAGRAFVEQLIQRQAA